MTGIEIHALRLLADKFETEHRDWYQRGRRYRDELGENLDQTPPAGSDADLYNLGSSEGYATAYKCAAEYIKALMQAAVESAPKSR